MWESFELETAVSQQRKLQELCGQDRGFAAFRRAHGGIGALEYRCP